MTKARGIPGLFSLERFSVATRNRIVRAWLALAPKRTGNLKLEVDVDPQSFL